VVPELSLPWWTSLDASEVRVGHLVAPSGEIVACDPLVYLERATAFTTRVRPGTYPITLGMLGRDVAHARIDFRPEAVAVWKPGVCVGEDEPSDLRKALGYPVDAGVGCFVDTATREAIVAERQKWDDEVYARVRREGVDTSDALAWHTAVSRISSEKPDLLALLEAAGLRAKRFASYKADTVEGNVVVFSSGEGDGSYPSFWGLNADGEPVCLITDFGLLSVDPDDDDGDDDE